MAGRGRRPQTAAYQQDYNGRDADDSRNQDRNRHIAPFPGHPIQQERPHIHGYPFQQEPPPFPGQPFQQEPPPFPHQQEASLYPGQPFQQAPFQGQVVPFGPHQQSYHYPFPYGTAVGDTAAQQPTYLFPYSQALDYGAVPQASGVQLAQPGVSNLSLDSLHLNPNQHQSYAPLPRSLFRPPDEVPMNSDVNTGMWPPRNRGQWQSNGGQRSFEDQCFSPVQPQQRTPNAEFVEQQPLPRRYEFGQHPVDRQRLPERSQQRSPRSIRHDVPSSSSPQNSRLNAGAQPFSPRSFSSGTGSTNSTGAEPSSPKNTDKYFNAACTTTTTVGLCTSTVTSSLELPKRPGRGVSGKPAPIKANFFRVTLDKKLIVYHYDVEIKKVNSAETKTEESVSSSGATNSAMSLSRGCKYRVFKEFCNLHKLPVVFDGEKNVFATVNLQSKYLHSEIPLTRPYRRNDPDKFSVSLQKVATLSDINEQAMVQALDIAIRNAYSETHIPVGRLLFKKALDVGPQTPVFEFGEGLFTSLRLCENGPFINADVTLSVFYEPKPLHILARHLLRKTWEDLKQSFHKQDIEDLNSLLRGLSIEAHNLKPPRKYVIEKVTVQTADQKMFLYKGQNMSVANYFAARYSELSYPNLPCVDVGRERFIPLEVCTVAKFQKCDEGLRKLHKLEQAKKILRKEPFDKFNRTTNAVTNVNSKFSVQRFLSHVSQKPVEFKARELTKPLTSSDCQMTINRWVIINASKSSTVTDSEVGLFAGALQSAGVKLNMSMQTQQGIKNFAGYDAWTMLSETTQMYPELEVLFVILEKSSPLYNDIKYHAETEFGLITQCVTTNSVSSKNHLQKISSNLMRKVNAKLGGAVKMLTTSVSALNAAGVMIIGADVSHHSPKDDRPSVAAIVASTDSGASRYVATVRVQAKNSDEKKKIEIIKDMEGAAKDLLRAYKKINNGEEPKKIIFYRDGVSEGQFSQVLESELTALREACNELKKMPLITFLTVQKRHRTRFFLGKTNQNVNPGTVVDTTITHPHDFDFYLCSHKSGLGTARPAHYYVLCDDNLFTSDSLQELTYALCHVYARCDNAVSIPAPVYYAHHAATRAACYLQVQTTLEQRLQPAVNNSFPICASIQDKMFFI